MSDRSTHVAIPTTTTSRPGAHLLVISPHLDDAVLSCGEVLRANPGANVLTVFGGKPEDDRLSSFDRWFSREATHPMILRRQEDHAALARLGSASVHLHFLDSAYGSPLDTRELVRALTRHLAGRALSTVLMPLGLAHRDHVAVRDACLEARTLRAGLRWVAYEELPYATENPGLAAEVRRSLAEDLGLELVPIVLTERRARLAKGYALSRYRSQMRALGCRRMLRAFALEKFWLLQGDDDMPLERVAGRRSG